MTLRRLARSARSVLPWALAAVLAAVAAYQARSIALLRLEIDSCHGAAAQAGTPRLEPMAVGKQVPELTARSIEGEVVHVAERGRGPALLLIYDPSCSLCEAAMPTWIQLYQQLRAQGSEAPVIGLSVADSYSTVQHGRSHRLPFPVVPFPSRDLIEGYGIRQIPLAAVVGADGRVIALWDRPLEAGERGDALELLCPQCLGTAIAAAPVTD
ncbi:MAG TPA: redoxin domain-containing protein [Thermoanaerobaculia bacterium]|nr:redoxin domain-containing protein [Thermoanaerobaculia bacterium]